MTTTPTEPNHLKVGDVFLDRADYPYTVTAVPRAYTEDGYSLVEIQTADPLGSPETWDLDPTDAVRVVTKEA